MWCNLLTSLRKHAYSNILKILQPKNETFQIKNSDIFHISAQNIDCGYSLEPPRRGGSNEYPQFMFSSRNKKFNVYPCKPQFYYIKVGFEGSKLYRYVFVMYSSNRILDRRIVVCLIRVVFWVDSHCFVVILIDLRVDETMKYIVQFFWVPWPFFLCFICIINLQESSLCH